MKTTDQRFAAIAEQLRNAGSSELSVLELGAGPGFLASFLLSEFPAVTLHLLDFSPVMHELARARLAPFADRVTFVERDLKRDDWSENLGMFDAVVTVQAVHELRHKCYAEGLHRAVRRLRDEHRSALVSAGFNVSDVLVKGSRVLFLAT